MHTIYETEAFVLKSLDQGESDVALLLFTEDFGKIYVKAKGVRILNSKLRYSIQEFSFSKVSLVCGKQGWRLVNASLVESLYKENNIKKFEVIKNVFSLIDKIIHTESKEQKVFEVLKNGFAEIKKHQGDKLDILECLIVLKILNFLGYLNTDDKKISEILKMESDKNNFFEEISNQKTYIIKNINDSLRSSQMWS